jgi:hypothetical protein
VFSFPNELDERCTASVQLEFLPIAWGLVEPRITLRCATDFPRVPLELLVERACEIVDRDPSTVHLPSTDRLRGARSPREVSEPTPV